MSNDGSEAAKAPRATNAQVLEAVRDARPAGDELYFDPTTGELVVGPAGGDERHPDAVTATTMAREGFFAGAEVRHAVVYRDALDALGGWAPAAWVDDDLLVVGTPPRALEGQGGVATVRVGSRLPEASGAELPFLLVEGEPGQTVLTLYAPDRGRWRPVPTDGPLDLGEVGARNRGVIETDLLAGRTVAIVGLGSGGSVIASELAKAGVGGFVLMDRDRLDVVNVGRHLCDVRDLGRRKTVAVADRLRARNPALRLRLVDADILADPDATRQALAGVDAIVAATDNNPSRLLLNQISVDTGVPVVFGRAFTRACGGDVIRVRPGDPESPCYACLIRDRVEAEEVSSSRSSSAPAYADRPAPVEPGLSLDIAPIAQLCARLVLQELVRGTGSSLESLDDDLAGSLFLWANRREGRFASWAPMGFGVRQMSVQRWYGVRARRDPACATCNPDAFLRDLEAEVARHAAQHGVAVSA